MRIGNRSVIAVIGAAITVATIGAASAGPPSLVGKATGGVAFTDGSNVQYLSFSAFDYGSTGDKGSVEYTNFSYPQAGSNVWLPTSFAMGFAVAPSTTTAATYAMNVDSFVPTGPTSTTFQGTGDCGCGWVSTFTGSVNGNALNLAITEINASNPAETYSATAAGTIATDGSVTGTWSDNYGGGRTGTFTIADIGNEVFHYSNAPVTSVTYGPTVSFSYTIPSGEFVGTQVPVSVTDGGSPAVGHDTVTLQGVSETLLGGNLSTH